MSFLDKSIDGKFMEALKGAESLVEAVSKWAGVLADEAGREVYHIADALAEAVGNDSREEAELAVLKMITPEPTLRDYLLLRSLDSLMMAEAVSEVLDEADQEDEPTHVAGKGLSALLTPEDGEMLVMLGAPRDGDGMNVMAIKADREDILGAVLMLADMFRVAKSLGALGGSATEGTTEGDEDGKGDGTGEAGPETFTVAVLPTDADEENGGEGDGEGNTGQDD